MTAAAEILKRLPVGFRFHPTEDELVGYYLQNKIQGFDSHANLIIADIDILSYEPWVLPRLSLGESIDDEWFFFSRPEYIPSKRNQIKRSTNDNEGYWKITGKEREIKAPRYGVIGKKRILTFYRGRNRKSEITNWVIHEYYIPQTNPTAKQRDIFLCRLIKKPDKKTLAATCDEGEPSNNASDSENERRPVHDMVIQMQPQENRDYFVRELDRMLASSPSNAVYNGSQSGFGDDEPIDEWVDSVFVDPDQESNDELAHNAHFNDSTGSRALTVVCPDGVCGDTNTDALPAQAKGSGPSRRTGYPLSSTRDAVKLPEKPKVPENPKPPPPPINLPKESITKVNKDKKVTQGKGSSFISWETIPLTSPRSVYFVKALLGGIFFLVFTRELVLCGNWC